VRRRGVKVDPFTGMAVGDGCGREDSIGPRFDEATAAALRASLTAIIGFGLASGPVDLRALRNKPPAKPTRDADATLLWVWATNLKRGDRLSLSLAASDGRMFVEATTEPLEQAQAEYVASAGRRRALGPGTYVARVAIMRNGVVVAERDGLFSAD